ncbi:hypothetical protein ACHAXT_009421 [Thalassiosira profunda]
MHRSSYLVAAIGVSEATRRGIDPFPQLVDVEPKPKLTRRERARIKARRSRRVEIRYKNFIKKKKCKKRKRRGAKPATELNAVSTNVTSTKNSTVIEAGREDDVGDATTSGTGAAEKTTESAGAGRRVRLHMQGGSDRVVRLMGDEKWGSFSKLLSKELGRELRFLVDGDGIDVDGLVKDISPQYGDSLVINVYHGQIGGGDEDSESGGEYQFGDTVSPTRDPSATSVPSIFPEDAQVCERDARRESRGQAIADPGTAPTTPQMNYEPDQSQKRPHPSPLFTPPVTNRARTGEDMGSLGMEALSVSPRQRERQRERPLTTAAFEEIWNAAPTFGRGDGVAERDADAALAATLQKEYDDDAAARQEAEKRNEDVAWDVHKKLNGRNNEPVPKRRIRDVKNSLSEFEDSEEDSCMGSSNALQSPGDGRRRSLDSVPEDVGGGEDDRKPSADDVVELLDSDEDSPAAARSALAIAMQETGSRKPSARNIVELLDEDSGEDDRKPLADNLVELLNSDEEGDGAATTNTSNETNVAASVNGNAAPPITPSAATAPAASAQLGLNLPSIALDELVKNAGVEGVCKDDVGTMVRALEPGILSSLTPPKLTAKYVSAVAEIGAMGNERALRKGAQDVLNRIPQEIVTAAKALDPLIGVFQEHMKRVDYPATRDNIVQRTTPNGNAIAINGCPTWYLVHEIRYSRCPIMRFLCPSKEAADVIRTIIPKGGAADNVPKAQIVQHYTNRIRAEAGDELMKLNDGIISNPPMKKATAKTVRDVQRVPSGTPIPMSLSRLSTAAPDEFALKTIVRGPPAQTQTTISIDTQMSSDAGLCSCCKYSDTKVVVLSPTTGLKELAETCLDSLRGEPSLYLLDCETTTDLILHRLRTNEPLINALRARTSRRKIVKRKDGDIVFRPGYNSTLNPIGVALSKSVLAKHNLLEEGGMEEAIAAFLDKAKTHRMIRGLGDGDQAIDMEPTYELLYDPEEAKGVTQTLKDVVSRYLVWREADLRNHNEKLAAARSKRAEKRREETERHAEQSKINARRGNYKSQGGTFNDWLWSDEQNLEGREHDDATGRLKEGTACAKHGAADSSGTRNPRGNGWHRKDGKDDGAPVIGINRDLQPDGFLGTTSQWLALPQKARNWVQHTIRNRKCICNYFNASSMGVMNHLLGHHNYAQTTFVGGKVIIYMAGVMSFNPDYAGIQQFKLENVGVPAHMGQYLCSWDEKTPDWFISMEMKGTVFDEAAGDRIKILWLNGKWLDEPIDGSDSRWADPRHPSWKITDKGISHPDAPHPLLS